MSSEAARGPCKQNKLQSKGLSASMFLPSSVYCEHPVQLELATDDNLDTNTGHWCPLSYPSEWGTLRPWLVACSHFIGKVVGP